MEPTVEHRRLFAEQIEASIDRLFGAAMRLTRQHADAEDLVADTVTRAWSALDSLKNPERFYPWLKRIMVNHFISQRRKAGHAFDHELFDTTDDDANFSLFEQLHQPFLLWWGNPEQQFLNNLLRDDIDKALNNLPEVFRVVIVLVDMEEFSYPEVAEMLGVPIGTVRSRLSRARRLLQSALWQQAKECGVNIEASGDHYE